MGQPLSTLSGRDVVAQKNGGHIDSRQSPIEPTRFHLLRDEYPAGINSVLNQPYVILDLLNTFYDDHVPAPEAARLLVSCLDQIQRLLLSGPVVVTLAPPLVNERAFLFGQVCRKADEVLIKEVPIYQPVQPSLF